MTTTLESRRRCSTCSPPTWTARLVRPGDAGWDAARQAWHLDVDQRPAAVVLAGSARDVVAVVDRRRERSGCGSPRSRPGTTPPRSATSTGTILLKTSAMRGGRRSTRSAGSPGPRPARMWQDVTPAAAEHGLAALAGSARDVGVAGYTLGGGLSWLARSHGLAANSVVALEVVTADGRAAPRRRSSTTRTCSGRCAAAAAASASSPRWSSGSTRSPRSTPACCSSRSSARAEVLQAWRAVAAVACRTQVTSVGRVLRFPPLPDLPPHLSRPAPTSSSRRPASSPPAQADALLAPLRALRPGARHVRADRRSPELALAAHGPRRARCPVAATGCCCGELPRTAVRPRSSPPRPRPRVPRCCRWSCVTSAAR